MSTSFKIISSDPTNVSIKPKAGSPNGYVLNYKGKDLGPIKENHPSLGLLTKSDLVERINNHYLTDIKFKRGNRRSILTNLPPVLTPLSKSTNSGDTSEPLNGYNYTTFKSLSDRIDKDLGEVDMYNSRVNKIIMGDSYAVMVSWMLMRDELLTSGVTLVRNVPDSILDIPNGLRFITYTSSGVNYLKLLSKPFDEVIISDARLLNPKDTQPKETNLLTTNMYQTLITTEDGKLIIFE